MSRRAQEVAFTSALFVLVAWFLVETLRLGRIARMVPLAVVVPTVALIATQLVRDLVPHRLRGTAATVPLYGMEWLRVVVTTTLFSRVARARDDGPPPAAVVSMLGWLVVMLALVYLAGLVEAVALFTFAYLRWQAHETWARAVAVAACVTAIPLALAHFRIQAGLTDGSLWTWLGY